MAFHEINGKQWFSEVNEQWKGQAMSLEVKEMLFDKKSEYQHVQVFESNSPFGTVLLLDGVIQITDLDECAYQEVVICEIDKMVIECGAKYFPRVATAWKDPRVSLHCGDGAAFVKSKKNHFDVIICDSSDPVGPATSLFTAEFYKAMREALRPGGKVSTQAETTWLDLDLIQHLAVESRKQYDCVQYAYTQIPTYPCGMIGFLICSLAPEDTKDSKQQAASCKKPRRALADEMAKSLNYYSKEMHTASFVLPAFARRIIYEGAKVERLNKTKIMEAEAEKAQQG